MQQEDQASNNVRGLVSEEEKEDDEEQQGQQQQQPQNDGNIDDYDKCNHNDEKMNSSIQKTEFRGQFQDYPHPVLSPCIMILMKNAEVGKEEREKGVAEKNNADQFMIMNMISTLTSTSASCAICLEKYEHGQKIAGSKNSNCNHYFHLGCITDWLLHCDKCALCREPFL